MKEVKFCAISDMHGIAFPDIEKCDVLLICGDTVNLYSQRYDDQSEKWFERNFIPWAINVPCEKIYIIGGNHDFWMENKAEYIKEFFKTKTDGKIEYLENEYATYKDINIFGTPICHKFFNWAFMPSDDEATIIFNDILYDLNKKNIKIDILMTHDSPYGCSDILFQAVDKRNIGGVPLRNFTLNLNPMIMVHGHLHSTNHEEELLGGRTLVYNTSLLDESYSYIYNPLYFSIEIDENGNKILK